MLDRSRLATLAPAASRNWPATNVSCRPWVREGLDFIEQKNLGMTQQSTPFIHSFMEY
jgi:hypothetical protein